MAASILAQSCLLACQPGFANPTSESNKWIEKGRLEIRVGQDPEAIDCFTKAIAINPNNPEAFRLRGDCESSTAMTLNTEALADYNQAVKLDAHDFHSLSCKSLLEGGNDTTVGRADLAKARLEASAALAKNPKNLLALRCLSYLYTWLGDPAKGLNMARQWAALDSGNPEALYVLGWNSGLCGQNDKAISEFERMVALIKKRRPPRCTSVEANILRGAFSHLKKEQEGIAWYSEQTKNRETAAQAYFGRGSLRYTMGDRDGAFKDFQKAIELRPGNFGYLRHYANVLYSVGHYKESAEVYQKAVEKEPHDHFLWVNLANSYVSMGKRDMAIRELLRASKYEPDSYRIVSALAGVEAPKDLNKANRYFARAVELVSDVIKKNPLQSELYAERSYMYVQLGRFRDALDDLNKAIKIRPIVANYYHLKAGAEWSLKMHKEAIADESHAITLEPNNFAFYHARKQFNTQLQRYQDVLKDATRCVEIDPRNPNCYEERAFCYSNLHDGPRAMADFKKAIELGGSATAYFSLGRLYVESEQRKEALKIFNKGLAKYPHDVPMLSERCNLHTRAGDLDLAFHDVNLAIGINPKNPDPYIWRADLFAEIGEYMKAVADLNTVLSLGTEAVAGTLDNRSRYYTYAQRYKDAADDQALAYRADPNPKRLCTEAKLRYHAGEKETAIALFTRYLRLVPDDQRAMRARAKCMLETHQYENSINEYTNLIRMNSHDPLLYLRRAKAYEGIGDAALASADKEHAEALKKPSHGSPH